ncbi:MAG: hypothetical protein ABIC82_02525 [bacterium]
MDGLEEMRKRSFARGVESEEGAVGEVLGKELSRQFRNVLLVILFSYCVKTRF